MRWVVVLAVTSACGRSGFGIEVDAARGSNAPDGAVVTDGDGSVIDPIDAPMGSAVIKFGETPTSNVMGVTSDTYLDSEVGFTGDNFGASTSLQSESSQKRALLKFALTTIPAGKIVVAARLHLYSQVSIAGGGVIYPVLENWTEGASTGQAGVSSWNMRTATQAWTTVGAGTPGSSGAQVATFNTPGTGQFGVDLPVGVVQGWVNTPTSNFGIMIAASGTNTDLSFSSSNNAMTANRPELVVTYMP